MNKKDSIDDICRGLKAISEMFFFSPLDYQMQVIQNSIAFFEGKSDFGYVDEVNKVAKKVPIRNLTNESRLFTLRVYLAYINSYNI